MRQLTTLQDEAAARRFAAWLVVQKIEARADAEGDGWAVWVIDEDQLPAARQQLAEFQVDPNNTRYRGAQQQAANLERAEQQKRELAQKNTIQMSGRWGTGAPTAKSMPVVLTLILISILVFVLTNWGNEEGPGWRSTLQFSSGAALLKKGRGPPTEVWQNIRAGEIWRLVTPMFLHFGMMHIAFNMMAMYDFGGQIESRIKSRWFLLMVLVLAAVSCVAQVMVDSWLEQTTLFPLVGDFGGMSGVNYGLFGFVFMRAYVLQDRNYVLRPGTSFILFAWLILCFASNYGVFDMGIGSVANTAHVSGMLAGMAIGYMPQLPSGKSR
jgi:GlpG protein